MKSKIIMLSILLGLTNINFSQVKMPEEVFTFKSFKEKNEIKLYVYIEKDYALYKDRIFIKTDNKKIKLKNFKLPNGTKEYDKFLGENIEKYYSDFNTTIKYDGDIKENGNLVINYQGCSKGFCYMPTEVKVKIN